MGKKILNGKSYIGSVEQQKNKTAKKIITKKCRAKKYWSVDGANET